jgi:alkanesulfonate monooxygenase SsuD/methylene tetrahydromethanopterin reductase-like flavin-dependent oxidoreductase (luciferase family)
METSSEWLVHPWVTEGAGRVRFGVMGGPLNDWHRLSAFVALAEELGFDSYWTIDHPLRGADWATNLAALAVTTRRLRLGTLVACIYYRNPVLLARQAADVDRLSGGRFVLGLGIGHVEMEFARMGIPFLAPKVRQAALAEVIRIVHGVWGAEPFSATGEHFRVDGATVRPGPVQQPRVALLIAGGGEKVTLLQVAQWADASNFGEEVHRRGGDARRRPSEARRA